MVSKNEPAIFKLSCTGRLTVPNQKAKHFNFSQQLLMGTGNSLLNLGSEHYQKWTEIPEFYGCTCCGLKEQDSAVLSLEQFTQNIILHVFFEADLLIYIILIDFCKTSHACTIYFQLLSQRKHVL